MKLSQTKQMTPNKEEGMKPKVSEWVDVLIEKVKYDPAELGSEWALEDIIDFVSTLLTTAKQEWATEIVGMIEYSFYGANDPKVKDIIQAIKNKYGGK